MSTNRKFVPVTFTPCLLWIFLGAPFVETRRSNKALSAALATITAAVVGVMKTHGFSLKK